MRVRLRPTQKIARLVSACEGSRFSAAHVVRPAKARAVAEVAVCDMDAKASLLIGVDGRRFKEVKTNLWMPIEGVRDTAYLGPGRHGGGIVLKPLYVALDGSWRNVTTGREAPLGLSCAFASYRQAEAT